MGYAAARGGDDAIAAANHLVERLRTLGQSSWLEAEQLVERLRLLVDRVMGEAGMWAPELAAQAIRHAEGDLVEAVHLLRAYRSSLPRLAISETVHADEMTVERRIVPAFRNPPGPQLLGRTNDYASRLFHPLAEDVHRERAEKLRADESVWGAQPTENVSSTPQSAPTPPDWGAQPTENVSSTPQSEEGEGEAGEAGGDVRRPRRLLRVLDEMDLTVDHRAGPRDELGGDDPEPFDISMRPARPPAPRSARLAVMARAETGALINLWYRNILGPDGYLHEITLGEVRHGRLPLRVRHGVTGEPVTIGTIRATEAEAIEDLDGIDEPRDRFDVGYGLCLGHNERKAIAMANLDIACRRDNGRTSLEQSILMTTDGLESSGFLEHLKLPHYVTFRSMVERKQAVRARRAEAERETQGATP